MTKEQPSYYAIIPANVRYDKSLKANEKLMYGEITCLSQSTGKCFASNQYFADLYGVSKETVSRWISKLQSLGFVKVELIYREGTKEIINRYIQINQYPIDEKINTPIDEKINTPIDEKVKDNSTRFNTTSNNNTRNNKWLDKPAGVSDEVWSDFNRQRKSKLTKTALKQITSQAELAGWTLEQALTESITRGWQSFKSEWVNKQGYNQPPNHSQASRHSGFDEKDYTNGLIEQEDGTYAF